MRKTSLLERAKKLNMPRRNCMKTKEEEAIKIPSKGIRRLFLIPIPPLSAWHAWMNFEGGRSLTKKLMRKLAWEGIQKNIVMDGDTMIDKRTGEVLSPEVDSTYWKNKF